MENVWKEKPRVAPRLAAIALAGWGLAGAAHAATYTNTVVPGTPFGISLDTGSTAWETPFQNLSSADTGLVPGTSSSNSGTTIVTETIPAQIGVEGAVNVYSQYTEYFYNTLSQDQSFNINYSSSLAGPISVPQSYVISGNIQNLIGSSLLNGGNGSVYFEMGMNLQFVEPYVPNSGNARLSFRLGTTQGEWTRTFERDFALNPGSIDLSNWGAENLAGFTFFEAEYRIDGNPGVSFGIVPGLSLSVSGGTSIYQVTPNGSAPHQTLVTSVPIPALLPPPVPEAETYAMMLAGLGLVGYSVSRRKRNFS